MEKFKLGRIVIVASELEKNDFKLCALGRSGSPREMKVSYKSGRYPTLGEVYPGIMIPLSDFLLYGEGDEVKTRFEDTEIEEEELKGWKLLIETKRFYKLLRSIMFDKANADDIDEAYHKIHEELQRVCDNAAKSRADSDEKVPF